MSHRGEIDIVGIVDRELFYRLARYGVNRCDTAFLGLVGCVGYPQGFLVPRRHDMLRPVTDTKFINNLMGSWINDCNGVGCTDWNTAPHTSSTN